MKRSKITNCFFALVVGGCFGLLAQVIWEFLLSRGLQMPVLLFAEMAVYVAIGLILYATGMLERINRIGGAGTLFPLIGLAGTVAGAATAARASGLKGFKAIWASEKAVWGLLLKGFCGALVFALLKRFVLGDVSIAPAATGKGMTYLWAFVIPGVLAAIAQVLLDNTKVIPPVLLLSELILGEAACVSGLSNVLNGLSMGAVQMQILGLGEGMTSGLLALFVGDVSAILGLVIALIIILLLSSLVGLTVKPKAN